MTIQDLYARKQQVIAGMNELGNKVAGGIYTAEQNEEFRKFDAELKGIDISIDNTKRAEEVRAQAIASGNQPLNKPTTEEKKFIQADAGTRSKVWEKFEKVGMKELTEEERGIYNDIDRYSNAFEKWFRSGGKLDVLSAEEKSVLQKRVQSVGTTTAGGYTVPEGFSGEIDKQLQTISELLKFARIYRTSTGNDIPWPTNNDTGNTGELLAENADASSASADLVFGVTTLKAFKFSSKMIKSSSELIQDNGVNLPSFIAEQLGERVGKVFNTYATTGTGSAQPLGYMDPTAGANEGVVAGSATAITPANIIDLMHSVDAAYRNSSKAAFAMNDLILAEIKKLSFGSSVYFPIWLPSLAVGAPDTILGKPYFVNNAMASALATENKVIAFGDWNRFVVRIVNDYSLRTLNERYAEFDQTAWVGFARMDSRILNRNAIKYLSMT